MEGGGIKIEGGGIKIEPDVDMDLDFLDLDTKHPDGVNDSTCNHNEASGIMTIISVIAVLATMFHFPRWYGE